MRRAHIRNTNLQKGFVNFRWTKQAAECGAFPVIAYADTSWHTGKAEKSRRDVILAVWCATDAVAAVH